MDELVELLKFLLVIDFLGNRRNGPQAVHDVILHKHGGIAAHGEGDGVTRTGRISPRWSSIIPTRSRVVNRC